MTTRTDLTKLTQGDIEEILNSNIALRLRVFELEAWCVRAQDAMRRALLLRIPSRELEEIVDSAPVEAWDE